jgi:hypothetical protein
MNVLSATPHIPRRAILPELVVVPPLEHRYGAMLHNAACRNTGAENLHWIIACIAACTTLTLLEFDVWSQEKDACHPNSKQPASGLFTRIAPCLQFLRLPAQARVSMEPTKETA